MSNLNPLLSRSQTLQRPPVLPARSTREQRMKRSSGRARSRRAMRKFCEKAANLQPGWGTSTRLSRPAAAPSCSTRSLAKAMVRSARRCT